MTGIHNKKPRAGFTLIETMISIAVFLSLVAIAIGGFVHALHTQSEVGKLISAQSNVSLGIEEMAREIRTGYLFCHNLGATTSSPLCDSFQPHCPINPDGSWTCPALDFFNANTEEVNYSLQGGQLMRSDSAENFGEAQPLTSGDVAVKYLEFRIFGNMENDGWTPRITVQLGIAPSSSDPVIASTTLNFETTVSARQIDCPAGSTSTKC